MRVLGAVETAPGTSRRARFESVSKLPFVDEYGQTHFFTWRTIETWWCRYQKHGITVMKNKSRSDRGTFRKVTPETVLEAVESVLPSFHKKSFNVTSIYRACIERGLLHREQVAPNTFRRMVREFEMLKSDSESKPRLAFAKEFANQMWQADTLVGPFVDAKGSKVLLEMQGLRKLRLLFEDFPKNHNLILIGQPGLMNQLHLTVNEDIKSRVTFSVVIQRLNPDQIQSFLLGEFDHVGLPHQTLSEEALGLLVRSSDGILRRARNLTLACLLEAVRDQTKCVDLKQVNRILLQPHWRQDADFLPAHPTLPSQSNKK